MKYYIPEWDDLVDPEYDFLKDEHSELHARGRDVYAYEIFGLNDVPYDGILVSRMKAIQNKKKYKKIQEEGIHAYLRLPLWFPVMADCGAWGYKKEEEPPFDPIETLRYYVKSGFNLGVTVDHLVMSSSMDQAKKRQKITLENAEIMREEWISNNKYFKKIRLIGVAQGWDIKSYRESVRALLQMGYNYIGIGGLAGTQTKLLREIMTGISYEVKKFTKEHVSRIDLHAFGIARPELLQHMCRNLFTSFDAATFLRYAWLGTGRNYYINDKTYTALRVRSQKKESPLKDLEERSLNVIRRFAKDQATAQEVVATLREYELQELKMKLVEMLKVLEAQNGLNELVEETFRSGGTININDFMKELMRVFGRAKNSEIIEKIRELLLNGLKRIELLVRDYVQTTKDKPWNNCTCKICKDVGIEVIIFRGNNRNRRRGFHNTYIFYQQFLEIVPKVLVVVNVPDIENNANNKMFFEILKEYDVLWKLWEQIHDLPVDICFVNQNKIAQWHDHSWNSNLNKRLQWYLKRYSKLFMFGPKNEQILDILSQYKDEIVKISPTEERSDLVANSFKKQILNSLPEACKSKAQKLQKSLSDFVM